MTTPHDPRPARTRESEQDSEHKGRSGGHGWMMIACCIPMLLIAVLLVSTGVAGPGFLLVAVMCTVMMAMMMHGMGGHGRS